MSVKTVRAKELHALRSELRRRRPATGAARWNANPDDVQRSMAQLVLTLVDFLRQLLERQAIRRLDEGTLSPAEIEAVGLALLRLEKAIRQLAQQFGLTANDLKLDLGPLGRLT
jgi:Gas vesicle protein K